MSPARWPSSKRAKVLPNTRVVLQASGGGPIKNLFTTGPSGINGLHYSIYNDPNNPPVDYQPFADNLPYNSFESDVRNTSTSNVNVAGSVLYIASGQGGANGCAADGYPDTGLQRPALVVGRKVTGKMKPAVPNPVADETTISYVLPTGTHRAELLVRTCLAGKEVRRISLAVGEQESRLSVRELPDGLYFCTLLADGVPVQTQRLLVAH